jgi:hypothetical protein
MNDEITRILELLEKGTITAEEAERLIRAAGAATARAFGEKAEPEAVPPVIGNPTAEDESRQHFHRAIEDFWDPFSPFANPLPDLGDISRGLKRIRERIKRHNTRRFWWNYFRLNKWYEHRRSQRRASMTTYERVRFVLLGAPAYPGFILQAQTDIHELLGKDRMAWDLFRFGLEEEFGIEVSMDQARYFLSVQDVVDWVEERRPSSTMVPETEAHAPSSEPDAAEPSDAAPTETAVESPAEPAPGGRGRPRGARGTADPAPEEGGFVGESGLPPVE